MRVGSIIPVAMEKMKGCIGEMAIALERQKPVSRTQLLDWIVRLRAAADELEKLTKGSKK